MNAPMIRPVKHGVKTRDPLPTIGYSAQPWPSQRDSNWNCERHPDKPMGHDNCPGAGILAEEDQPLTPLAAIPPGTPVPLLDHGFIRLVDHMGSDLSIVRAARASYDADWRAGEDTGSDTKLIKYLMKHQHNTPFEAVTATFEVKAPIFVIRQWHRHRTQSYNEVSARYTELPEEFYVPELDQITGQHASNKQGRSDEQNPMALLMQSYMRKTGLDAFALYRSLLENGCPRELARTVLPTSTYTRMFTTMNLRNLFGFTLLRDDPHAQYEIRVYAKAMLDLIEPIFPVCLAAYRELHGKEA